MPTFNRSLSTTKLVHEIFYITFECSLHDFEWQSRPDFVKGATGKINMSLSNTTHFMEIIGYLGQGSLIENGFI